MSYRQPRAIWHAATLLSVVLCARLVGTVQVPDDTQSVTVGTNVHVSAGRPTTVHGEVTIAASQKDAGHMIVCAMGMRRHTPFANSFDIVYASTDGGRTWKPTLDLYEKPLDDLEPSRTVDVDCTYGPDGEAYFVASAIRPPEGGPAQAWVYRSPDGGTNWLAKTVIRFVMDRPYLGVDHTQGPYRGRVYLSYAARFLSLDTDVLASVANDNPYAGGIALRVSTDGGLTFPLTAEHFAVPGSEATGAHPMSQNLVLSDGTLLVFVHHTPAAITPQGFNSFLKVMRSNDGGTSLSPARVVTDLRLMPSSVGSSWLVSAAVDGRSKVFRDRLYVVWADRRSGRSEIWFTTSSDKGVTWTRPRIISDDQPREDGEGPHNAHASVAVNREGAVGVSWYDRREHRDNIGYYVRFRASLDGGETWLPSVRVSTDPMRFDEGEDWLLTDSSSRTSVRSGPGTTVAISRRHGAYTSYHHAGLTADAEGTFHPVWTDNRTDLPQVWTAPVRVKGVVARHGGGRLSTLTDVSSAIELQMLRATFDEASNTVIASIRLHNKSKLPIHQPVKVRVLSLSSELGSIAVSNAENGFSGAGAVWDFSRTLGDGRLDSGESSAEQILTFTLTNRRPSRDSGTFRSGLLALNAIVLAAADR